MLGIGPSKCMSSGIVGLGVPFSRIDSIKKLIAKAQEYGEIKMLVNGAGVSPSQAPIEAILNVDLYGTAVLLEEVGKVIAEVTFPETEPGVYTIDHTFVDGSLRGQGMASKLVQMAVDEIQNRGGEVRATCSYAKKWLEEKEQN